MSNGQGAEERADTNGENDRFFSQQLLVAAALIVAPLALIINTSISLFELLGAYLGGIVVVALYLKLAALLLGGIRRVGGRIRETVGV